MGDTVEQMPTLQNGSKVCDLVWDPFDDHRLVTGLFTYPVDRHLLACAAGAVTVVGLIACLSIDQFSMHLIMLKLKRLHGRQGAIV